MHGEVVAFLDDNHLVAGARKHRSCNSTTTARADNDNITFDLEAVFLVVIDLQAFFDQGFEEGRVSSLISSLYDTFFEGSLCLWY